MISLELRTSPGFMRLLRPFSLEDLEKQEGTVFGLWSDLRIAYLNPWWFRFARENGGEEDIILYWGLGRSIMDCVPDVLRTFYINLYESALKKHPSSGPPIQHQYECSSDNHFRLYLMTLYRLEGAGGILVVNSTVIEKPHDIETRPPREGVADRYTDKNGFIHQCSNCRRIKNLQEEGRWDWVPLWVRRPIRQTSHTLCYTCFAYLESEEDDA